MTYQEMLTEGIVLYTGIYPTEEHFLKSIFFTNGNGYEFQNGEPVDQFEAIPFMERLIQKNQKDATELAARIAGLQRELQYVQKFPERIAEIQAEIDTIAIPLYGDILPITEIRDISEFCLMYNLPDDITEDWLRAAWWAFDLVCNLKMSERNHMKLDYIFNRLTELENRNAENDT